MLMCPWTEHTHVHMLRPLQSLSLVQILRPDFIHRSHGSCLAEHLTEVLTETKERHTWRYSSTALRFCFFRGFFSISSRCRSLTAACHPGQSCCSHPPLTPPPVLEHTMAHTSAGKLFTSWTQVPVSHQLHGTVSQSVVKKQTGRYVTLTQQYYSLSTTALEKCLLILVIIILRINIILVMYVDIKKYFYCAVLANITSLFSVYYLLSTTSLTFPV